MTKKKATVHKKNCHLGRHTPKKGETLIRKKRRNWREKKMKTRMACSWHEFDPIY